MSCIMYIRIILCTILLNSGTGDRMFVVTTKHLTVYAGAFLSYCFLYTLFVFIFCVYIIMCLPLFNVPIRSSSVYIHVYTGCLRFGGRLVLSRTFTGGGALSSPEAFPDFARVRLCAPSKSVDYNRFILDLDRKNRKILRENTDRIWRSRFSAAPVSFFTDIFTKEFVCFYN